MTEPIAVEAEVQRSPAMDRLAVFLLIVVNLGIVGYAIHQTRPQEHATQAAATAALAPGGANAASTGDGPGESAVAAVSQTVTQIDLPSPEHVQANYVQHCAACHGLDGRGNGPAAEQLYPKPRDFIDSPLRFASTGGGPHQVVDAIERTIMNGVPRSAMPGFHGVLTESEIAGLARQVSKLRESAGQTLGEDVPLDIGQRPPLTAELEARGKQLFRALACVTCHGEGGRGDGAAARGLRDMQGKPVTPADLASGLFKSGQNAESLARTILKGVPGTPMTPYEMALIHSDAQGRRDATDVWALVAFIQNIGGAGARVAEQGAASGARIVAHLASDDALLSDPTSIEWLGVEESALTLRPLWQRVEDTHAITVRAARNADSIAICMEWKDATLDLTKDHAAWPDAAGMMLAPGPEAPALPMGVSLPGLPSTPPVNVWHWKADRQLDAVTGSPSAGLEFPPVPHGATLVFAPGERNAMGLPQGLAADLGMTFDVIQDDPAFIAARAAGNLATLVPLAALESNAIGFGTLTPQPDGEQDLTSAAVWSNGRWRVVIRRPLAGRGASDVSLAVGKRSPVAFAVWNGAKGDRAGVKLITGWHWLELEGAGGGP